MEMTPLWKVRSGHFAGWYSNDALYDASGHNVGYMAGMVKDFFDRVWATVREKLANKPYVTFGSKGGGGAQAIETVERILDGFKMVKAADTVLATRKPAEDVLAQCRELGKKLAHPEKMEKPKGAQEPRL